MQRAQQEVISVHSQALEQYPVQQIAEVSAGYIPGMPSGSGGMSPPDVLRTAEGQIAAATSADSDAEEYVMDVGRVGIGSNNKLK